MKIPLFALTLLMVSCTGLVEDHTDASPGAATQWRVLADEYGFGGDPRVSIATTDAEYEALWSDGLEADRPPVNLGHEVVVAFTVSYESGCEFPFAFLDVDHAAGTISPRYMGNEPGVCGDDENPYTVAIAIGREGLTADRYDVRLTAVHPDVAASTAMEVSPND